MTTITIHNLPENLEQKLRDLARTKNQSINQTVKSLLEAGLSPSYSSLRREQNRERFKEFFGTWTKEEAQAFDKTIQSFNQIDRDDWTPMHIVPLGRGTKRYLTSYVKLKKYISAPL